MTEQMTDVGNPAWSQSRKQFEIQFEIVIISCYNFNFNHLNNLLICYNNNNDNINNNIIIIYILSSILLLIILYYFLVYLNTFSILYHIIYISF